MFKTIVVEKIKTHTHLCSVSFFENLVVYMIKWEKCSRAREATDGNIGFAHFTLGT